MMTTYEILKNELENRYHLNAFHNVEMVEIDGHEKAATVGYLHLSERSIHLQVYSYSTCVLDVYIPSSESRRTPYLEIRGLYSMTTRKHLGWWMGFLRALHIVPPTWDYYTLKRAWEEKGEDYPRLSL